MDTTKLASYGTFFTLLMFSWLLSLGGLSRVTHKTEEVSDNIGIAWLTAVVEPFLLALFGVTAVLKYDLFSKCKYFVSNSLVILTVMGLISANQCHVLVDHSSGDVRSGFQAATAGFCLLTVFNFAFVFLMSVVELPLSVSSDTSPLPVTTPPTVRVQMSHQEV